MNDNHFWLLKYWAFGTLIWVIFVQNSGWDQETLSLWTYLPPVGTLFALFLASWTSHIIIEKLRGHGKRAP